MNLRNELNQLVQSLSDADIPYALCGGLAMAVYGWPRATMDIDLLVEGSSLAAVRDVAKKLGYHHESGEAEFSDKRIKLFRLVKLEGEEFLPLDLLIVTPELQAAWDSRHSIATESGALTVVSLEGLIQMKGIRSSGVDRDDIQKLKGESNDES